MSRSLLQLKKQPTQSRSRLTLESLLQAGAEILRQQGYSAFTVERIAGDCGVSVGTFYEYFAHKDGLIAELRRRHSAEISAKLMTALADAQDKPISEAVPIVVTANVELHQADPLLHKALTVDYQDVGVEPDDQDATEQFLKGPNNAFAEFLSLHLKVNKSRALTMSNIAFVLSESLTHAAIIDGNLRLDPEVLIDEITLVIMGYFAQEVA